MDSIPGKISEVAQMIAPSLERGLTDIMSYPFLTAPNDRLYSIYLVSFALIGAGLYFSTRKQGAFTLRSLFGFLFPREIYLNGSSFLDLKFYIIDRVLRRVLQFAYLVSGFRLGCGTDKWDIDRGARARPGFFTGRIHRRANDSVQRNRIHCV